MVPRLSRVFVSLAAAILATLLTAQPPKTFEVASVRLVDSRVPSLGGRVELENGRFFDSNNVYNYITTAFRIPGCPGAYLWLGDECPFLIGGPAWVRRDTYEIRATLPEGTPTYSRNDYYQGRATAISSMLEALLRDRFQLKIHHEMREGQVFLLTVAKGGPKAKLTADPERLVLWPDGTMRPARSFGFERPTLSNGQRLLHLKVQNRSMHDVAEALTAIMKRPVLDRTDLVGNFDWTLDYAADLDVKANGSSPEQLTGPELFSAIQEQAGLRLESAKEKIDVIVIDSIERPSEN